jgi:hypothetical protein
MMCSEGDPAGCHRAWKLTAWILRNTPYEVQHITRKGLIDAREFEPAQHEHWLWHEYGGKADGVNYPP